jgi:dTMP kinase
MKGKLITFEGPEGAGKSTVIRNVFDALSRSQRVILTKEPGSPHNDFCTKLRKLNLDPANEIDAQAEIFLYLADRAQHVKKVILPHLEQGTHVLCDRYIDSTIAYQGFGRGYDVEKLKWLNAYATAGLVPDLSLFLMVDPQVGLARATKTEFGAPDRFEKEALTFHENVRKGYEAIIAESRERTIEVIETTALTAEEVTAWALQRIETALEPSAEESVA